MKTNGDREGREAAYFLVGITVLYAMALAGTAAGMSTVIGVLKLWGIV